MLPDTSISKGAEMSHTDFARFSQLIYELCGINLHEGKKELVKARLGKRIRSGGFQSFRDYYQHVVEDRTGQELIHLLDSISTNFTSFFREPQHFDYLRREFLPEYICGKKERGRKLQFWSAGCSSGEEAYSIAMTLLETMENPASWALKILGTDLSTRVLKEAESGIYPQEKIRSLPPPLIKKYFLRGSDRWKGYARVKESLKHYVTFRRLNLMEPFSFPQSLDGIFCRNVMIYFDKRTQASLVRRFHECLAAGGVLLIGHSESLAGIQHPFRYVKPAVYQKER